jgi:hypothetical protein
VLPVFRRFSPGLVFSTLLASLLAYFRTQTALQLEILALRHQLGALQRSVKKPKLTTFDRWLWTSLCDV